MKIFGCCAFDCKKPEMAVARTGMYVIESWPKKKRKEVPRIDLVLSDLKMGANAINIVFELQVSAGPDIKRYGKFSVAQIDAHKANGASPLVEFVKLHMNKITSDFPVLLALHEKDVVSGISDTAPCSKQCKRL